MTRPPKKKKSYRIPTRACLLPHLPDASPLRAGGPFSTCLALDTQPDEVDSRSPGSAFLSLFLFSPCFPSYVLIHLYVVVDNRNLCGLLVARVGGMKCVGRYWERC